MILIRLIAFLLLCQTASAQQVAVSGYVVDSQSGEALIGASVYDTQQQVGTTTNRYGYFSLRVKSQTVLKFSYIGYDPALINVNSLKDTVLTARLLFVANEIVPVSVSASSSNEVLEQSLGLVSIPVQQLKAVPALLGESDIIKALALTPGVTTGSEGTTGLQVRGGTPDQNLIILDDAIVYNVSHLFGFVSTFNPDAIHKVDLYKAGFPARYGGRLSSVIDVTMKEGNNQRRRVEAGVGLVGSRLLIEGPLGDSLNGRSSYMVSARSSYFTLFLLPTLIAFHRANSGQYFNYWLYDINAKANHQFRDGGRLLVSVYNGNDFWGAQEGSRTDRSSFNLNWGNTTATLRYTRTLLSNLFFRSTLTYSRYRYSIETQARTRQNDAWETVQRLQASSTVRDLTAKVGFEWTPNTKHTVMAGVDLIKHRFRPTQIETTYALNPDTLTRINASKPATEMAAYLEDELRPVRWLKTNLGLRAVSYQVGARNYEYVEPRLTLNVIPSQRVAIKLAYTQMHQFVHFLSSNSIGLPNDIWVPATEQVPPQASEQTAVGVTYTVPAYSINLSIDAYLKRSTNLIDYQTGTNFLTNFNRRWETTVERNGVGESRGIEVMASKTQGQLTGWVSYTLARHRRRFATIDQNRWYAASFDRRHVFSMTGQCKFSEKVSGVATWIFQSGQPTTVPISLQENIGQEATAYPILIYGDRNNYRMPAYHRLDLGITVQHRTRRFRNAQWSFGVYNAYNRANPFYLDIERGLLWGGNRQIIGYDYKVVRKAVFPVLPYVSYNLVFD